MSGGVDSSVVVHLLKEQGITPDIYYIRIGMEDEEGYIDCPAEEDIEITQWLAHHYGCRFEEVNLHREYWEQVVSYTIETVRRGLTPNPDVMCNKLIKFGAFVERRGKDYDRIATGHYARTVQVESGEQRVESGEWRTENGEWRVESGRVEGGKWKVESGEYMYAEARSPLSTLHSPLTFLATAVDPVKDQTDFLSQLSYDQIRRLMFPIGGMMKSEVRAIAARAALPSADRKDSQGICFLGKINYNDFLRRYLGEREGKIVELETGRVLGTHRGYWFHTIGQRKGLYLSGGPWFVVKKDIEANVLYVSQGYEPAAAHGREMRLAGFHWLSAELPLTDVKFKIRHTPEFHQGHLTHLGGDMVLLQSDEPIQGIAAGQYATIYDNDAYLVVATGMIA